jgi:aryl-alcohol dehydrogenase-like predicted oxidoreductase
MPAGLRVSELFLGVTTFADGFAHGADRGKAQRIVGAYADAGGNTIDAAVNYRDGASEQIVGEVLAGRDRFVLCTKYGYPVTGPTRTPSARTAGTSAVAGNQPAPTARRLHRRLLAAPA